MAYARFNRCLIRQKILTPRMGKKQSILFHTLIMFLLSVVCKLKGKRTFANIDVISMDMMRLTYRKYNPDIHCCE